MWDDSGLDPQQFFAVLTTVMAASPEFLSVDLGEPPPGVRAYEGDGGVIVSATFNDDESGNFTVIAAAETVAEALPLALALTER